MKTAILECLLREPSQAGDGTVKGRYCFPESFIGFQGHFPGNPILPAVVQIQAAQVCICRALDENMIVSKVINGKFLETVEAGAELVVECNPKGDGRFLCKVTDISTGRLASSFQLVLA